MAGREELVKAVRAASHEEDGKVKLACAAAFRVAAEQKVAVGEIGRICNQENIRICKCQLGCFK